MKKVGPTRTVRYIGSFEDQLSDNAQVKHIFAGSIRVATRIVGTGPNVGTYFVHGDHLGSLNVLTNSDGAEVQRLTYLPFGETHTNVGSVDFHDRRYTGQRLDPETGLYFYEARYYNPVLGRFLSPDTIVPDAGNPQTLNRYIYVINNPINYVDPTGHFSFKKLWKGIKKWTRKHQFLGTVLGLYLQSFAPVLGVPVLAQTEAGRDILAGEIIVATAVATWECGGCGVGLGASIGSAVGGGLGGYAAVRNGGDFSKGFLFGAAVGAASGATAGYVADVLRTAIAGSLLQTAGREGLAGFVRLAAYAASATAQGTIVGAGSGAIAGYAGGAGSFDDILAASWKGVQIGAASGLFLGLSFYTGQSFLIAQGLLALETPIAGALIQGGVGVELIGRDVSELLEGLGVKKVPEVKGTVKF